MTSLYLLKNSIRTGSILTLVFTSLFLISLGMISHNAFAMGPSGCNNEYDGTITSFIINNGSQTFDAIANPGMIFNAKSGSCYNVTLTIHTPNTSSQNNTITGNAWYEDSGFTFIDGHCVPNVGPNQDVITSATFSDVRSANHGYLQSVSFSTRVTPNNVTYKVQWLAPPSYLQNLNATDISSSQINLRWNAPLYDGGSPITGYMIERSTDNGTTWSTIVSDTGSTGTTYSDTGLVHSTTYTYRVSAINAIGTSTPSNTASATTFNVVPTPPTGLTATGKLLQINLSWTAPSDNGGTPITGYVIERSTDGGSTWSTIQSNTSSTDTTYYDTSVLPLLTYTYRVSAINDVGTCNPSNT
ncbi:MAG: fibronectin type III domain-containing protein, partial [Nitrosotalea sp.]